MDDLIKKMQYADTWAKEDISWTLSAYNQEIGDHTFFKELIYRAHEAKIIEPVFVPTVRKSMFEDRIVFAEYNFDYKTVDVRNWVKSKKWQCFKIHNKFIFTSDDAWSAAVLKNNKHDYITEPATSLKDL